MNFIEVKCAKGLVVIIVDSLGFRQSKVFLSPAAARKLASDICEEAGVADLENEELDRDLEVSECLST